MFERLQVMLMKEFLELRRDPWAMFRLIVPLLIQMLVFGYAATFTVHHVATAVLDLDHSQASRGLISHFVATGRFDIVDVANPAEPDHARHRQRLGRRSRSSSMPDSPRTSPTGRPRRCR